MFGIPGDFVLPFFRLMEESQVLPLYTLSHEPGVGFAADAAAFNSSTRSSPAGVLSPTLARFVEGIKRLNR